MTTLMTMPMQSQELPSNDPGKPATMTAPVSAPVGSVGHRLIAHARESLAAGDELVAVLMLRMAYEAFDRNDRRKAV